MRIAVCDDEKAFLDLFVKYCRNCTSYIEENYGEAVIESFFSGEELLDAYQQKKRFDILFLDLKMKRLNGFEAAGKIRSFDNKAIIIFITSLAQMALKSFEYRPFWFLIKPVTEDKFRKVFFKALSEYASANFREFSFRTREEGIERINIGNIIYLESISRQVRLKTTEEDYFFYGSISKEEERLTPFDFIRVHKSYLVNPQYIQRINKMSLTLKNGEMLPISERRYKAVFDFFTNYLARSCIT